MSQNRFPLSGQQLQKEMQDVFERFFGESDHDQSNVVTSQWAPRVDIKEDAEQFVIFADIPGVEPSAIDIHMDKGILSIRGERVIEEQEDSGKFSRRERTRGTFYRRFALPDSADAEGIAATGKHGVLAITIPKKPETQPRKIEVK